MSQRSGNPWSALSPGDEQIYNISDEVTQICQKLGLYPSNVARIDIHPAELRAEIVVFELDDQGKKYVDPETNEGARRTEVFRVRT